MRQALVALTVTLIVVEGAAAATPRLVTIDRFGVWTFERLGYADVTFDVKPRIEIQRIFPVRYRLPASARQGPRNWYLINLRFRITFAADSGGGRAYVSAATGAASSVDTLGYSVQIIFDVERVGDRLRLTYDSLGLVSGHEVASRVARTATIRFSNYVPFAGVRPGINVLMVQVKQYGDVKVERVRIFKDSSIEFSSLGPPTLRLAARARPMAVDVGEEFDVTATVRNGGELRTKRGNVGVAYIDEALELHGAARRPLRPLGAGEAARAVFRFEARRPGRHRIEVTAASGLSYPAQSVSVVATERTGSGGVVLRAGVVLALAALAGAAIWFLPRRRRS